MFLILSRVHPTTVIGYGQIGCSHPIQSPEKNPGERREEEDSMLYSPSYFPVCTPQGKQCRSSSHISVRSPEKGQFVAKEPSYEGNINKEEASVIRIIYKNTWMARRQQVHLDKVS